MRKIRRGLAALLIIIQCVSAYPMNQVFAFDTPEHDEYLECVLFGQTNFANGQSQEIADRIKALEFASYLTIDQYNGKGDEKLQFLDQYKVSDLPDSISEIDFTGNSYHRMYTHLGWEHTYGSSRSTDRANWPVRKMILLNTANKVFGIKKKAKFFSSGRFIDFEEDPRVYSFCALVYYIHVLGDRMHDEKYYGARVLMETGGRHDKNDIVDEIMSYSAVLFSDQTDTATYTSFDSKIRSLNAKISNVVNSEGGVNTQEEFELYNSYAYEMMDILKAYVPQLLRNEPFFYTAFY